MDIPSDEDPLSTLHHYNLGALSGFTFTSPDDYLQRGMSGTRAGCISSDGTVMGYHWNTWMGITESLLNPVGWTFQVQTTLLGARFRYGFDLHLCKRDGKPRRVQEFTFKMNLVDERWPYNAVYYTTDDW